MTTPSPTSAATAQSIDYGDLHRDLLEKLLSLNVHAFCQCLALLLERLGYEDVQLAGRTEWRGRNHSGGYELSATLPVPPGKRRILIQAKQYPPERLLFQRAIDELRGTCLRVGASEAVLVTTSGFSASLRRDLLASALLAPVRLLDGRELLEQMIVHRIGIWEEPSTGPNEPAKRGIDTAFFDELEQTFPGGGRPQQEAAQLVLTLSLRPSARATKKVALPRRPRTNMAVETRHERGGMQPVFPGSSVIQRPSNIPRGQKPSARRG